MPWLDFLAIAGIAIVASVVVAALGGAALLLARRASLPVQLGILGATAVGAVAVSMIAVANRMFLSPHDLTVTIYVAGAAGVVALVFSVILGAVVSRNFRNLRAAARSIGDGRPVSALGGARGAEFRELDAELRATSEKLAESREREQRLETARRDLIAGISHDLRTPLAGIRVMAEALEDGMVDDEDRYLRQMRVKVDQLSSMVDDLFELSKIDSGTLALSVTDVSLYDIVSDAVADLGIFAEGREISVEATSVEDLTVRADPRELSRAIGNLLLNAVQHTAPGTPITVSAGRSDDGRPSISVIDQGGGIAEDDLARVFEPGWRGTSARSPLSGGQTAGAGLGLAIVRGIIQAHHGEATVRNIPGGCRFDLVLPAA